MERLTYAAAIFIVLSTAGATFAQAQTAAPQTGNNCAMDYFCKPPKGTGIDKTNTTNSNDPNAARLRSELGTPKPRTSSGPEEPEQPIGQPIEPEAPISGSR